MKKILTIIIVFIILGAFLIFLNPISAGTIHVYPGDDIVAIVGAAASGDTIYVHAGTYDISGSLLGIKINNPNVTIIGDDHLNTIIDCRGGSAICIGNSDPHIDLNNTTIKNLTLRNFIWYGITLYGNNVTIENCKLNLEAYVSPMSSDLLYISGVGNNWTVKNVSTEGHIFSRGLRFNGISGFGNNWLIDGFEFDRNEFKSESTFRPLIGGGDNWTVKNGTINNNTFENGGDFYGFQLVGTNLFVKNISVSGNKMLGGVSGNNILEGTYFGGIWIEGENFFGEHSSIINCTVSNNALISNNTGEGFVYGIMAWCTYVSVENCIVTSNTASDALTPVYGIWVPPYVGYNSIKYSNSWNNKDNWGQTIGGYFSPGVEPGEGCISTDPIFAKGPLGDFYLSNQSPCVDSGSESSIALELYNGFTTRTDGRWDTGTVDMGFHYQSNGGTQAHYLPVDKILKIVKENQED